MKYARLNSLLALTAVGLLLAACGENSGNSPNRVQSSAIPPTAVTPPAQPAPAPPPTTTPINQPPLLSGTAPAQATVGQPWAFQPQAVDPDGDALNISASNLPGWMTLDKTNNRLSGTPGDADVQTWNNIVLTVSDGNATASLPPFSVDVVARNAATGSATLSWLPPTQQLDGTPIDSIAGYRLLYGQTSGQYGQSVTIDNPGITSYMIEGLTPGDWYFAIQTLDGAGLYGPPSAELSKSI